MLAGGCMTADNHLTGHGVEAAVSAFIDSAEAIDEEVVPDVVPPAAPAVRVVVVDASHDRWRLLL